MKTTECVGDLKLERISIRELPADTEAKLARSSARQAEGLTTNPDKCQILICSVRFFPLCYRGEAMESPISTGACTVMMLIVKKV